MKRRISGVALASIFFASALFAWVGAGGNGTGARVKFPDDYRHWTHVKSMVIQPGDPLYSSWGGIHHVYANWKAFRSMRNHQPYPDGAVLVFDLLEAREENHSVLEGPRKVVAVMQKDSEMFARTGGWGFEGFRGGTRERLVQDAGNACFSCHEKRKEKDYVFSEYRR